MLNNKSFSQEGLKIKKIWTQLKGLEDVDYHWHSLSLNIDEASCENANDGQSEFGLRCRCGIDHLDNDPTQVK